MTDNTQELEEILSNYFIANQTGQFETDQGDVCWYLDDLEKNVPEAKQAILDWHNKRIEEVLDRLLDGTTTIHLDTQPNNPIEGKIEPMLFKSEVTTAIEAERNKLNNSDGDVK